MLDSNVPATKIIAQLGHRNATSITRYDCSCSDQVFDVMTSIMFVESGPMELSEPRPAVPRPALPMSQCVSSPGQFNLDICFSTGL